MRASLWPVAAANSRDVLSNEGSMPFSFSFWKEYSLYNYNLNNIKGFITALPIYWSEGENNLIPNNTRLIASNSIQADDEVQIANNDNIRDSLES
ncbi:hypothetical protein QPR59_20345 [Enterobacter hormaechei]|uniref:hypothetical protein n=1 Tax=Enterobacter hormaechei TaxID=158836 RepID=UPI002795ACA8|nr:hypothetical protein [Enterobacter hormaechei]WMA15956.1 hypothetical protein QPR59_20345 [Enterobacter hormaechei]